MKNSFSKCIPYDILFVSSRQIFVIHWCKKNKKNWNWHSQNRLSYLAQVLKTTTPCYGKNLDFSILSALVSILTRLNLRSLYPTKKRLTPSHQRWRWMTYLRTKTLPLVTCSSFLCSCYEHLPNTANSKEFFQTLVIAVVIPVFFACRQTKSNKFHWYNELYYLKSSISLLHIIIDVVN